MALIKVSFTTGEDEYFLLEFITKLGGPYVHAKQFVGVWSFENGTFTIKQTP